MLKFRLQKDHGTGLDGSRLFRSGAMHFSNVLFLEKIAPSRVTHARVCCEDSAQRKTNKMASEITFVGDE